MEPLVIAAKAVVAIVAALHVTFAYLEIFRWNTPRTNRAFGISAADEPHAAWARPLATNQGVYNLFLAAGLVWSLVAPPPWDGRLALFFLGCVLVAAIVGAATVSKRILLVQGAPAVLGLALAFIATPW